MNRNCCWFCCVTHVSCPLHQTIASAFCLHVTNLCIRSHILYYTVYVLPIYCLALPLPFIHITHFLVYQLFCCVIKSWHIECENMKHWNRLYSFHVYSPHSFSITISLFSQIIPHWLPSIAYQSESISISSLFFLCINWTVKYINARQRNGTRRQKMRELIWRWKYRSNISQQRANRWRTTITNQN